MSRSNSVDLSVIIPSLRPNELGICIDSIKNASRNFPGTLEIVVSSPFKPPQDPIVVHAEEGEPAGICRATDNAYVASRGDVILTIADDMILDEFCLRNLMQFMTQPRDEVFLSSVRGYSWRETWPSWGFYGRDLAYCPCIRRSDVNKIGGFFFDPYYHSIFGEHDLSLRVWAAGGTVEICTDAWFESASDEDSVKMRALSKWADDERRFFARWDPRYGAEVEYSHDIARHFEFSQTSPYCKRLNADVPPELSWILRDYVHTHGGISAIDVIRQRSAARHVSYRGMLAFLDSVSGPWVTREVLEAALLAAGLIGEIRTPKTRDEDYVYEVDVRPFMQKSGATDRRDGKGIYAGKSVPAGQFAIGPDIALPPGKYALKFSCDLADALDRVGPALDVGISIGSVCELAAESFTAGQLSGTNTVEFEVPARASLFASSENKMQFKFAHHGRADLWLTGVALARPIPSTSVEPTLAAR
jgi:glycosyltransferase involved in cell wall biosynthesis